MIQPEPRVPNCLFLLENSETQDWIYPYQFDYIHLRAMSPCFQDIRTIFQRSFDHMKPGGWIELQDATRELQCIDDTARGTALEHWFQLLSLAGMAAGRDMDKAKHYRQQLLNAGYVDVTEVVLPLPGSPWPSGKKWKKVGMYMRHAMNQSVDSYRKFLSHSGITPQELDNLSKQTKADMNNIGIHWYVQM